MQLGIISGGRAHESSRQLHTTLPSVPTVLPTLLAPWTHCHACRGSIGGTNLADCDRVRPAQWWPEPPSRPKNWPHLAMSCFLVRRGVHACHLSLVLFSPLYAPLGTAIFSSNSMKPVLKSVFPTFSVVPEMVGIL